MTTKKWTSEENEFLMSYAYRVSWAVIAAKLDRTELACQNHYDKIKKLRQQMGTWKGLGA